MAITETISSEYFIARFESMRPKQFSIGGLIALYDYLVELSDDMGKNIELDIVAISCEYSEYDSLEEILDDYPTIETKEDLEANTVVINIPNEKSLIIGQF